MINSIYLVLTTFIFLAHCNKEPKFAPYIFISKELDFKLVEFSQKYGIKAFSLAFALGGVEGCKPQWFDNIAIDDPGVLKEINAFKALGGQLIVSTGGAGGMYLENACHSAHELSNAYKRVLDVTGATGLDLDIESTVPLDVVNAALVDIQTKYPDITVSFTVPVQGDDYGMNKDFGVDVLTSAAKHGVRVDTVNLMVMNYYMTKTKYWESIPLVAQFAIKQMAQIWPQKSDRELYAMLGLTPMIGLNNNQALFMPDDAIQVVEWAKQNGVGHLGFWSINRDMQCTKFSQVKWTEPVGTCSSIKQQDFEFTKIFNTFLQ